MRMVQGRGRCYQKVTKGQEVSSLCGTLCGTGDDENDVTLGYLLTGQYYCSSDTYSHAMVTLLTAYLYSSIDT